MSADMVATAAGFFFMGCACGGLAMAFFAAADMPARQGDRRESFDDDEDGEDWRHG